MVHIPIWLLVAGILVLAVPLVYYIYDAFCKPEDVNQGKFMMIEMIISAGSMMMIMLIIMIMMKMVDIMMIMVAMAISQVVRE